MDTEPTTPSLRPSFPRAPLILAAAAIAITIVGVAFVRSMGVEPSRPAGTPQISRELRFEDTSYGAIRISDAQTGELVRELAPGTGGFVRATLRGLARERKRSAAPGPESPFRLTAWSSGQLTLEDPETGRFVDLGAFGPTQVETFTAILLGPGGSAQRSAAQAAAAHAPFAPGGTPR
jgi:putative photosynthetic complex assembly protein